MDPAKQAILDTFTTFLKGITDSITTVNGTTQPDMTLIQDYTTLQTDIKAAVAAADATIELATLQTQQTDFTSRYDALGTRKTVFMATAKPKVYAFSDILATTTTKTLEMVLFFLFATCVLLGGIIMSHTFLDSTLTHRIFYFIYGAAFFPLSLLWGTFNPPYWRATLFPWILKGRESFAFTKPPLSFLWSLIAYSAPNPMDRETLGYTHFLLRVLSLGSLVSFIAFFWIVNGRLPI